VKIGNWDVVAGLSIKDIPEIWGDDRFCIKSLCRHQIAEPAETGHALCSGGVMTCP